MFEFSTILTSILRIVYLLTVDIADLTCKSYQIHRYIGHILRILTRPSHSHHRRHLDQRRDEHVHHMLLRPRYLQSLARQEKRRNEHGWDCKKYNRFPELFVILLTRFS